MSHKDRHLWDVNTHTHTNTYTVFTNICMTWKFYSQSSSCGSAVMNLTSIHEDVGSIPGPLSGLRIRVLPWAGVYVADRTQNLHCCSCGAGQQLCSSISTPSLGTSICCSCSPKKQKEKKSAPQSIFKLGIRIVTALQELILFHQRNYLLDLICCQNLQPVLLC